MSVEPIGGITPVQAAGGLPSRATDVSAPSGFGDAMVEGLTSVSDLEHSADALIQDVATGGPTKIHDVMVATTRSGLAVDMLVQVRDRALEAYHEVMRLQL